MTATVVRLPAAEKCQQYTVSGGRCQRWTTRALRNDDGTLFIDCGRHPR